MFGGSDIFVLIFVFLAILTVFLGVGGRWYTFDARHNKPRIGRILMARGRDATDVAIVTSFGPCTLPSFKVITQEVTSAVSASPGRIIAFALGGWTMPLRSLPTR